MLIYRAMKANIKGRPELGRTGRTLGVRIPVDIQPDEDGYVHPKTGGMSFTPENPMLLPRHKKPLSMGGTGRDPVFQLDTAKLSFLLAARLDNPRHGTVEPANKCLLTTYEQAIISTQENWEFFND